MLGIETEIKIKTVCHSNLLFVLYFGQFRLFEEILIRAKSIDFLFKMINGLISFIGDRHFNSGLVLHLNMNSYFIGF